MIKNISKIFISICTIIIVVYAFVCIYKWNQETEPIRDITTIVINSGDSNKDLSGDVSGDNPETSSPIEELAIYYTTTGVNVRSGPRFRHKS